MKVDLHGLPLSEAKIGAQVAVGEAWTRAISSVELIHGIILEGLSKIIFSNTKAFEKILRLYTLKFQH